MNWKFPVTLLVCLISWSCTERLPIEALRSDDRNWAPEFVFVNQSGYGRVEFAVDRPPRNTLLRNIMHYTVRARDVAAGTISVIDTIGGISFGVGYATITAGPGLLADREYGLQVVVHYDNGSTGSSPEALFTTPSEKGKITGNLPAPFELWGYDESVAFSNGRLFIYRDFLLYSIDTTNGVAVQVTIPNIGFSTRSGQQIAAIGDTIYSIFADSHQKILRTNLQTQIVDTLVTFPADGSSLQGICSDSSRLFVLVRKDIYTKAIEIDPVNGDTILVHANVPYFEEDNRFAFDGTSFWFPKIGSFNNRLLERSLDLSTVIGQHRNPVFLATSFCWDGANFWVLDFEKQRICKVQLEGL